MSDWDPLRSSAPLIAYTDFKSPYAFAAWEPTWQLAERLAIEVDWRPLVLDIASYMGRPESSPNGASVAQSRSSGQRSQARYAYHDARRYVALKGMTLRGTTRIWDTSVAASGLLWAKRAGAEAVRRFGDTLFERFWRREIDVERMEEIEEVLTFCDISADGWREFHAGAGGADLATIQERTFDAGIFGVPSYVCAGEVLFGREHLPRVLWLLSGRQGAGPDIAYEHTAALGVERRPTGSVAQPTLPLTIWIDIADPACYLALEPTLRMVGALGIQVEWRPARARPTRSPRTAPRDAPRGERHRAFRAAYRDSELQRYAADLGHPEAAAPRARDSSLAGMALAWSMREAPDRIDEVLARLMAGFWQRSLDIASREAISRLLAEARVPAEGFGGWSETEGSEAIARSQSELDALGGSTLPLYLLDGEAYSGRQHLPMLYWLIGGRSGAPPI